MTQLCPENAGGGGVDIGARNNKGGGGTAQLIGDLFLGLGVKFYQVCIVSTLLYCRYTKFPLASYIYLHDCIICLNSKFDLLTLRPCIIMTISINMMTDVVNQGYNYTDNYSHRKVGIGFIIIIASDFCATRSLINKLWKQSSSLRILNQL